ncbi:MAG: 3'(2'),5'-bisphosphate nucleotidase CysQ [Bacteroidota bacterium]
MSFAFIQEVQDIARRAGAAILEVYHREEGIEVQQKEDQSPLTLADQAANRVICEGLEQLPTVYPIVSEENKAIPYEQRKGYPYYWLVDPLDGTKEFIKRNGEFTVNIALIHEQRPVVGVVYVPVKDEMYWAVEGEGAYLQKSLAASPQKLQVGDFKPQLNGLRIVCSRSHLNAATEKYVAQFDQPELVPRGSSLKFLIIAEGEAQVYPRLAPTMEWDTGAAQIILEEAGGAVLQAHQAIPLQYNKPNLLNPSFIAFGHLKEMGEAPLIKETE